jgi:MFS family permease
VQSGTVLAVWASGTLIGSALAARIALHLGTNRSAFVAGWLCVLGLSLSSLWSLEISLSLIFIAVFFHGAGLGLFQVSYSDWVLRTLPIEARGVAGGLTVFTRTIGVVSAALLWLWLLEYIRLGALTRAIIPEAAFLQGFRVICSSSAILIATFLLVSCFVRGLWFKRLIKKNE